MSFDVFVGSFRHGDAVVLPSAAFHAVFGPYADHADPERHFWHVETPDGGQADVYADVDSESCDSVMLNHFDDGHVLDLLAEFARQADAVIMPVGAPVLLTAPGQREHLPEGLLDSCGSIVIANGHDITAAIASA